MFPNQNKYHFYILPVLFLEYLAIVSTCVVLQTVLFKSFGNQVYIIMDCMEFACRLSVFMVYLLFGKISDMVGQQWCLLVMVLGTCVHICLLALLPLDRNQNNGDNSRNDGQQPHHVNCIWIFVTLLALSVTFSSIFLLRFACILNLMTKKEE